MAILAHPIPMLRDIPYWPNAISAMMLRKLLNVIICALNSQKSTQDQLETVMRKGPRTYIRNLN